MEEDSTVVSLTYRGGKYAMVRNRDIRWGSWVRGNTHFGMEVCGSERR